MSLFLKQVKEVVREEMRSQTGPVQGYIPAGQIDKSNNLCTVRIPNPHGGIHPSDNGSQNYIELTNVPLPWYYQGIIGDLASLFQRGDRGVMVGFKGGNMAHPFIMHPVFTVGEGTLQSTEARTSVSTQRVTNVGGSHKLVPPSRPSFIPTFENIDKAQRPLSPLPAADPKLSFVNAQRELLKAQIDQAIRSSVQVKINKKK